MEERAELVGGERVHFLVLDLRQGTGGATGGEGDVPLATCPVFHSMASFAIASFSTYIVLGEWRDTVNIEAYSLDTLRKLVRDLQAENKKPQRDVD